jgi:DNA-binding NtrC family response regulator
MPKKPPKIILIIDDQSMARKTLRRMLEYYKLEVLEGADAREGVEIFNRERARIGLVLLDATLPGVAADKMLTVLRSIDKEAKIALCTEESVGETKSRDDYADLVGVLKKPIRTDRLLAIVRQAMDLE